MNFVEFTKEKSIVESAKVPNLFCSISGKSHFAPDAIDTMSEVGEDAQASKKHAHSHVL
jgi:hypothetical protein